MKYSFSYRDAEGDEYTTEDFNSKSEAIAEEKRLRKLEDGCLSVIENWIDDDEGNFVGRW